MPTTQVFVCVFWHIYSIKISIPDQNRHDIRYLILVGNMLKDSTLIFRNKSFLLQTRFPPIYHLFLIQSNIIKFKHLSSQWCKHNKTLVLNAFKSNVMLIINHFSYFDFYILLLMSFIDQLSPTKKEIDSSYFI